MRKIYMALGVQLFSVSCFASPTGITGNDIVQMCKGFDTGQAVIACSSYVYGFVGGDAAGEGATLARVKGLKADWCTRAGVTVDQEARTIYKWIVDHPAIADQPGQILMHEALKESFPCATAQDGAPSM